MTGHGSCPCARPARRPGPAVRAPGRSGDSDADGTRRTGRPPAGRPRRAAGADAPRAVVLPDRGVRVTARHGDPAADARAFRRDHRAARWSRRSARVPGTAPHRSRREGGRRPGRRTRRLRGARGAGHGVRRAAGRRLRARPGPWRHPGPGHGVRERFRRPRSAYRCAAGDGYRPEGPSAGAKGGRPRSAGPRPRRRARTAVRARRRPGGRGARSRLRTGGLTHRSPAGPASGTGVDRSLTPAGSIALIALPSLWKRFGNAYENYCTANTSAGFRVPGIGANPVPPRENASAG